MTASGKQQALSQFAPVWLGRARLFALRNIQENLQAWLLVIHYSHKVKRRGLLFRDSLWPRENKINQCQTQTQTHLARCPTVSTGLPSKMLLAAFWSLPQHGSKRTKALENRKFDVRVQGTGKTRAESCPFCWVYVSYYFVSVADSNLDFQHRVRIYNNSPDIN